MDWSKIKNYIKYTNYFNNISNAIKYSSIYKISSRNDYKQLQNFKEKYGVYLFTERCTNTVLYVGQAATQSLYLRVKQHFVKSDTGGLRYKLRGNKKSLERLNNSELYIIPLTGESKREILFYECYLISKFRPDFNFSISLNKFKISGKS